MNRQYGHENSKYVVIFDPLPTSHETRHMRSERCSLQKHAPVLKFYLQTAFNRHRSPIEVV